MNSGRINENIHGRFGIIDFAYDVIVAVDATERRDVILALTMNSGRTLYCYFVNPYRLYFDIQAYE